MGGKGIHIAGQTLNPMFFYVIGWFIATYSYASIWLL